MGLTRRFFLDRAVSSQSQDMFGAASWLCANMVVEWGGEKEEKSSEVSRLSKPSSSLRVQLPSAFLQQYPAFSCLLLCLHFPSIT